MLILINNNEFELKKEKTGSNSKLKRKRRHSTLIGDNSPNGRRWLRFGGLCSILKDALGMQSVYRRMVGCLMDGESKRILKETAIL
jgi:hypothetical protein